jgi:hypothetical protein
LGPKGGPQDKVSILALGKRVFADQAVMAPIGLVLFISSMGIMEGKKSDDIQDKFRTVSRFHMILPPASRASMSSFAV